MSFGFEGTSNDAVFGRGHNNNDDGEKKEFTSTREKFFSLIPS
jgi:hypothetical protein